MPTCVWMSMYFRLRRGPGTPTADSMPSVPVAATEPRKRRRENAWCMLGAPLTRLPLIKEEFEQVGEFLPRHELLQAVRHQRHVERFHRLNVFASHSHFGKIWSTQVDRIGALAHDQSGHKLAGLRCNAVRAKFR